MSTTTTTVQVDQRKLDQLDYELYQLQHLLDTAGQTYTEEELHQMALLR